MGRRRSVLDVNTELSRLFRTHGYEGLSLSDFEQETGMARASLYYRFPDGKDSMAQQAFESITNTMQSGMIAEMDKLPPDRALEVLKHGLLEYYENGQLGCILGAFAAPSTAARFRLQMQQLASVFQSAVERLLIRKGSNKARSKLCAEDFLADVQGSLIISSIAGEPKLFVRRLKKAVERLSTSES
jgi:TetR/AcrR family transcriptional regulator, lmrAB and yxaGH operons repressor